MPMDDPPHHHNGAAPPPRRDRPEPARALPGPKETADLVARCLRGDKPAWEEFVTRFVRLVMSTVGRTFVQYDCTDLADHAEDISQEVFLNLLEDDYRVLRTLRDPARLPGWLASIARHKAVDALRRQTGAPRRLHGEGGAAGAVYPMPEALELDAARLSLAREAIGTLEDGDRLLIELFYFEQRRYRDIALLLGIPENTVASRLYRIKRRLLQHVQATQAGKEDDV